MANILITGVAGFIGSHTADALLQAGHRVWGVDDLRTGRMQNIAGALAAGLDFNEFSVLDSAHLDRLVKTSRIDAIIHLAALVSVPESISEPELNFRLNLEAAHRVAEAARCNAVKRLVFASSAAVYGNTKKVPVAEDAVLSPLSPYGAAKLASEYLLLSYAAHYGVTVRIQRYFNVFGRRQDPSSPYSGVVSVFVRNLCQGKPITIQGDGRQTRDFIAVADVARANLLAATKPEIATGVANICTGRPVSLLALAQSLSRIGPLPPLCFAPAREGDIRHSAGTTNSAQQALGFESRTEIFESLAELVAEQADAASGCATVWPKLDAGLDRDPREPLHEVESAHSGSGRVAGEPA